ncbi:MAG: C-GCAxxG-C-C family protein [Lachnospiraceae bacterium]|nr:C-GCAxxG-C-C family protein [Lachnospiraceae bacterium]
MFTLQLLECTVPAGCGSAPPSLSFGGNLRFTPVGAKRTSTGCPAPRLPFKNALHFVPVGAKRVPLARSTALGRRYRAQCGLIEGALMFIGLYFSAAHMSEKNIVLICYQYAREFEKTFGSLSCRELRPGGFSKNDPPHLCESITCQAIEFAYLFIQEAEP